MLLLNLRLSYVLVVVPPCSPTLFIAVAVATRAREAGADDPEDLVEHEVAENLMGLSFMAVPEGVSPSRSVLGLDG